MSFNGIYETNYTILYILVDLNNQGDIMLVCFYGCVKNYV